MRELLFVFLGGGIGSVLRYGIKLITKAVKMLEKTEGKPELQQMGRVLARVKKRLTAILNYG